MAFRLAVFVALSVIVLVYAQGNVFEGGISDSEDGPLPYPTFYSVPDTNFLCKFRWGFFADPETQCQVFHFCRGNRFDSFLCPNGTLFHKNYRICDHWYNVPCP
ncbi:U-scoloptoxin(01)-Er1a-like isoform X2 [Palaemon carinicauda]|uniref:U-scoloptoxin(01)-Er1a-like isoform X2 n=1 Tax=Palaemon carinicauda TaxID=392227 RepID=UPI0035B5A11A